MLNKRRDFGCAVFLATPGKGKSRPDVASKADAVRQCRVAQLSFFIGKGGVGKTTVSAAYALWSAAREPRRKILLLSTDPAHSIGDVLQIKLGDKPKRIGEGALYARQLDPERQVRRFLDDERDGILGVVESGTFFSREEIEPLLDATLPGMAEVAALVALHELLESNAYDEIVVDTAPMGHTLRLFEMPEHFARFLRFLQTASSRDELLARRFAGRRLGPNPFIARWQLMLGRVREALAGTGSQLILVTTPEPFALNESARAKDWLRAGGLDLQVGEVVLNRVIKNAGACATCKLRADATKKAVPWLKRNFPWCELHFGEDPGGPLLGVDALRAFGDHVFGGGRLRLKSDLPKAAKVSFKKNGWPALATPLSLTLGKGGVGKTTLSAAMAFRERKSSAASVTVCSTDPAPSLRDIFKTDLGNTPQPVLGDAKLRAAEFDALAEFRAWAEEMKARISGATTAERGGLHLDLSFDREVLLALLDVVPPGVDEIFATFRIMAMIAPQDRMLIDMAPTGHALELLRTPDRLLTWTRLLLKTLAAHRTLPLAQDAAVEVATVSQKLRELSKTLRDGHVSAVWPVMLAETLPDRETERLMLELKNLRAPVAGLFVNRILFSGPVGRCRRCRRERRWQLSTLARIRSRYREVPIYAVPDVPGGIAGRRALKSFTSKLWQMQ